MRRILLGLVVLAACTKVGGGDEPAPREAKAPSPAVAPRPTPPPTPVTPAKTAPASPTIVLTAVTLADDCGGTAPYASPTGSTPARKLEAKSKAKADAAYDRAARARCEQTSMQLSVTAPDASRLQVKSVELFDDAGRSLGTLVASRPTRWSEVDGMYQAWDETLAAGSTTNVSYVLSQPAWAKIPDRWNRTFTLKTVVTIGGVDQTAEKSVTLSAPTTLPPNVKT